MSTGEWLTIAWYALLAVIALLSVWSLLAGLIFDGRVRPSFYDDLLLGTDDEMKDRP